MLSVRCDPGSRPPATRRFLARCRRCDYEFVERSRPELVEAVEAHEAECSDDAAEWRAYRIDGEHSLSSSPPQRNESGQTNVSTTMLETAMSEPVPFHRGRNSHTYNGQAARCKDNYRAYVLSHRQLRDDGACMYFVTGPFQRCPRCRSYVFGDTDTRRYTDAQHNITGCFTCLRTFCD